MAEARLVRYVESHAEALDHFAAFMEKVRRRALVLKDERA